MAVGENNEAFEKALNIFLSARVCMRKQAQLCDCVWTGASVC